MQRYDFTRGTTPSGGDVVTTPFVKMHGAGNDCVVLDARDAATPVMSAPLARAIGDRRVGVGFDQLVVIRASAAPDEDAVIDFWNRDGSTAGACGNATRCVADLLMMQAGVERLTLRTERGALFCERRSDGRVRVDMGAPKLDWRDVPLAAPRDTAAVDIDLGGALGLQTRLREDRPGALSMGNPHAVFFVDTVDGLPIERIGPILERHTLFPERANIGFAEIRGRREIRLRVWERGAGLTLACGSGACAALVAAARRDLVEREAMLELDGGVLEIAWRASDDVVAMTGPTQRVFDGVFDADFLATAHQAPEASQ